MIEQYILILAATLSGVFVGAAIVYVITFIGMKDIKKRIMSDRQIQILSGAYGKQNPFYKGDGGNGI